MMHYVLDLSHKVCLLVVSKEFVVITGLIHRPPVHYVLDLSHKVCLLVVSKEFVVITGLIHRPPAAGFRPE
jgi:hypothetical protein